MTAYHASDFSRGPAIERATEKGVHLWEKAEESRIRCAVCGETVTDVEKRGGGLVEGCTGKVGAK